MIQILLQTERVKKCSDGFVISKKGSTDLITSLVFGGRLKTIKGMIVSKIIIGLYFATIIKWQLYFRDKILFLLNDNTFRLYSDRPSA